MVGLDREAWAGCACLRKLLLLHLPIFTASTFSCLPAGAHVQHNKDTGDNVGPLVGATNPVQAGALSTLCPCQIKLWLACFLEEHNTADLTPPLLPPADH